MPVYSISRTSQYTTEATLETVANQNGMSYNGFPSQSIGFTFTATPTGICPTTNLLYNYTNVDAPVTSNVWYPYAVRMDVCGGNPDAQGQRPGYAWIKLWSSTGTFLMGYTATTPTLTSAGAASISFTPSTNGVAVQSTEQLINNSRNTLAITTTTTYIAGFTNSTNTLQWSIIARTTGQTGQSGYVDTSTGSQTSNFTIGAVTWATTSIMGYITYNNAPVQPTNFTVTTTSEGISFTCRGDEVRSLSSGTTVGAVSSAFIFYTNLATLTTTKVAPTTFSRTLNAGTVYNYAGTLTSGPTLGVEYAFAIATINDVCIATNANSASARSTPVTAVFGLKPQLFFTRNVANNAWSNAAVGIRDATDSTWSHTAVYKRNTANTGWIFGATETTGAINMQSGTGALGDGGDAIVRGTAAGGLPPYTISWTYVNGNTSTAVLLRSASGNPTSTANWYTNSTSGSNSVVRMTVQDSTGQTASATTTITWVI